MSRESVEQISNQIREHISGLFINRQLRGKTEVVGFPNSQRTYRRIDFIVTPPFPIDPRDIESLENFRKILSIDVNPYDDKAFQLTSLGHLRLGSLTYKEPLPGKRQTYQVTTIKIDDPKLQGPWTGLSSERLEREEPLIGLVGIRPYPNYYLAYRVAEYELDLLKGYAREDLELNKLRVGISARLIHEMEADRAVLPRVQMLTNEEWRQITLEDRQQRHRDWTALWRSADLNRVFYS